MDSCKHLDERRLTGTVLTDNRMDFARLEFKINGLQGVGGTETLVELFEHEKKRAGRASSITVTALLSLVHRRLLVIRCSGGVARRNVVLLDAWGQELLRTVRIHILLGDEVHPRVHIL